LRAGGRRFLASKKKGADLQTDGSRTGLSSTAVEEPKRGKKEGALKGGTQARLKKEVQPRKARTRGKMGG